MSNSKLNRKLSFCSKAEAKKRSNSSLETCFSNFNLLTRCVETQILISFFNLSNISTQNSNILNDKALQVKLIQSNKFSDRSDLNIKFYKNVKQS